MFDTKPAGILTEADLQDLVSNRVRELRTLDYKQELPGRRDRDQREFLEDVTSFANSGGGSLIHGIREERDESGKPTGFPEELLGLPGVNLDEEINRLESLIRTGTEPRLQGCRFQPVPLKIGAEALVVRIPQSWAGPHAVTYLNNVPFFVRRSNGKMRLNVPELREAFLRSETIAERIRRFRTERIGVLMARETPVQLIEGPLAMLHLIPFGAFDRTMTISVESFSNYRNSLQSLRGMGADQHGFNADGFLGYSIDADQPGSGLASGYVQAFREGIVEYVEGSLSQPISPPGQRAIAIKNLEIWLVEGVERILDLYRALDITPPVSISLSMLGVRGQRIWVRGSLGRAEHPIQRDEVHPPDLLVETLDIDVRRVLRPTFDVLWNAGGWPRSSSYDEKGVWKG